MTPGLVSIVIPCYNQARFVGGALASAFAQDYPSLQVVLVDDGSTDDLAAALAPYGERPVLELVRQENRGLPAARNRGIEAARGEYLKFLDADDWLAPQALSRQVAAFESGLAADPHLGFVYCDLIRVRAPGREPADTEAADTNPVARMRRVLDGDILPSLLVGGYFTPQTVLIPRRVLDHVGGFDLELGGTADTELWMRIMCEGYTARFVPEALVYYRLHDDNMSLDRAHMRATHRRALEAITTRYPQRVANALDELIAEHARVDADSAWARSVIAAQAQELEALRNALGTRGVRTVRALERWLAR